MRVSYCYCLFLLPQASVRAHRAIDCSLAAQLQGRISLIGMPPPMYAILPKTPVCRVPRVPVVATHHRTYHFDQSTELAMLRACQYSRALSYFFRSLVTQEGALRFRPVLVPLHHHACRSWSLAHCVCVCLYIAASRDLEPESVSRTSGSAFCLVFVSPGHEC